MQRKKLPYIPAAYRRVLVAEHPVFVGPSETESHVAFLRRLIPDALRGLRALLEFDPRREIAVCCYATNEDAVNALGRQVNATMALAPFADTDRGLVVVQSGTVHSLNADRTRMLRVLVHELTHLFVLEVSDSTKLLGDANAGRSVPAWLDEGLAEVCSCLAVGAASKLDVVIDRASAIPMPMTFSEVSLRLDELDSTARQDAFVQATATAWHLVRARGTAAVFRCLLHLGQEVDGDQPCLPSSTPG